MDRSPTGFSVLGIFQAGKLDWSGLPCPSPKDLSKLGTEPMSPSLKADSLQSEPLVKSQEHWNGLPFPFPGDLPDPGIKLASPASAGGFFTTKPSEKPVFTTASQ